MLLLTRKLNETVAVHVPGHGTVHVMVARIRRGDVRLGIVAPKDWPVVRGEVAVREEVK